MKMPFSRTRKYAGSALITSERALAGGVIIAIALIVLALRAFAPGAFTFLAIPFWKSGDSLADTTERSTGLFGDKGELIEERDRLLHEKEALIASNAVAAAKVQDLTKLLGTRTEAQSGIVAGVLARPPVAPYDMLVLDQGTKSGVAVGNIVQGPGGVPVGVIDTVSSTFSRALLYSAPARSTEGWIGEARLPVTIEGAGSGAFRTSVAREAGIVAGDTVYAPGPGAIPIGTVVRVDADPASARATVHIQPLLNPFTLTWVTIVQ